MAMKISNNNLVSMTYSIYEGATLLESVDTPVSFIFGKETNLLPIVENSLKNRNKGDQVSIEVSPDLGFGAIDEALIFTDTKENVPEEYSKVGLEIDFANERGGKRKFRVTDIKDNLITFDGNHPFAGKNLIYKIKIIDVVNTEEVKE
tara:strand:- start:525 stop:968 length:444 start_codon:yes stop_codon:yes gene_type:complete